MTPAPITAADVRKLIAEVRQLRHDVERLQFAKERQKITPADSHVRITHPVDLGFNFGCGFWLVGVIAMAILGILSLGFTE